MIKIKIYKNNVNIIKTNNNTYINIDVSLKDFKYYQSIGFNISDMIFEILTV